jgi:hypothetical protein
VKAAAREYATLAEQFVRELVGDAPPRGALLAFWSLADRSSRFLSNSLAVPALGADGAPDFYISSTLAGPGLARKARVSNETAVGLLGLHLDLDLAGTPDGRGGVRRGAPSEAAALELAHTIHPPTLIVATGGGWQPWWIFDEPWIFGDATDRLEARALLIAWQAAHRARVGWPIDSTHDLARVLRLPGTVNAKDPENPRRVTYTGGGPRITPSVGGKLVETYRAAAIATARTAASFHTASGEAVAFGAIPDRVDVRDRRLLELLDHVRGPAYDLSAQDFAIACESARLGYADAEIVALLRDHRQRHGDPRGKAERVDYLERTISAARAATQNVVAA